MIHYMSEQNTALVEQLNDWQGAYNTLEERADRIFEQNVQLDRRLGWARHELQASRDMSDRLFDMLIAITHANPNLAEEREAVLRLIEHPNNVIDLTDLTTDEELSDEE